MIQRMKKMLALSLCLGMVINGTAYAQTDNINVSKNSTKSVMEENAETGRMKEDGTEEGKAVSKPHRIEAEIWWNEKNMVPMGIPKSKLTELDAFQVTYYDEKGNRIDVGENSEVKFSDFDTGKKGTYNVTVESCGLTDTIAVRVVPVKTTIVPSHPASKEESDVFQIPFNGSAYWSAEETIVNADNPSERVVGVSGGLYYLKENIPNLDTRKPGFKVYTEPYYMEYYGLHTTVEVKVRIGNCTSHKYKVTTVNPTCTKSGYKKYTCTLCGYNKTETLAKKGHRYGSWKKRTSATVFKQATRKRTCSSCKSTQTQSYGSKVKAKIKLNARGTVPLKVRQTLAVKVSKSAGDSVKSWKTSNKKVATVSKSGKVKGKKSGKARITVTLKSGKKASFVVKVQKSTVRTKSIKSSTKKITLRKGKTYKLSSKISVSPITSREKIRYSSKNKRVVTVSSKGTLRAKRKGTTYITVKSGKKSTKVKVTVK